MRCPVGLIDPDDTMRRPHDDHTGCSNGFLMTLAGKITCSFLGNGNTNNFRDFGRMEDSTVQASIPRFYDDKADTRIDRDTFDRIYMEDESITVVNWHLFAASVTGVDRLQFPAIEVSDLIDANGIRYHQGIDFDVKEGRIVWRGTGPGVDPTSGKGVVCSIRYRYRPYWYIERLLHEVRVAQVTDEWGNTEIMRMPQQVVLKREIFFHKEDRDPMAPQTERQKPQPASGQFGPR
jgi:hypothetical protein